MIIGCKHTKKVKRYGSDMLKEKTLSLFRLLESYIYFILLVCVIV